MIPIMPKIPKTVNAISIFVILTNLQFIKKMTKYQKYQPYYNSYPEGVYLEFIGYQITYNHKSHYKLAYIITILGEVVYLLFIQHG